MVVAGGDVGHQRAEHVERGLVALDGLLLHVHGDLVHRHVAGPFDHHLAAPRPRPRRVSSPRVFSSANWAASEASAIEPGRRLSPRLQVTSYLRMISEDLPERGFAAAVWKAVDDGLAPLEVDLVTSASTTLAFGCRLTIARSGLAISAGESAPVAT